MNKNVGFFSTQLGMLCVICKDGSFANIKKTDFAPCPGHLSVLLFS